MNKLSRGLGQLLIADVSLYQSHIDWGVLKGHIDGVIIRVGFVDTYYGGDTNKTDPNFKEYQKGARSIDLKIGYYYYAFADEDPKLEANRFIKGIGDIKSGESIWLDIEDRSDDFTKEWTSAFLEEAEKLSYRPCHIYTDINWAHSNPWISLFKNKNRMFWLAKHSKYRINKIHDTPLGEVKMHQYTRKAKLPGISTKVDLSIYYGNEKDWLSLAKF